MNERQQQRNEADRRWFVARAARANWERPDILSKPKMTWTPHLATLLAGLDDESCILSKLKGHETSLLRKIYAFSIGFVYDSWRDMVAPEYKKYVHNTLPAIYLCRRRLISDEEKHHLKTYCDDTIHVERDRSTSVKWWAETAVPNCAFIRCGTISFPSPTGIDVNMLPFIMGDKASLPDNLQKHYDPLIAKCPVALKEFGKVCYLTITESHIEQGDSQQRGGLRIEAPLHPSRVLPGRIRPVRVGGGSISNRFRFNGGIYIASTVSDSCAIWDALIGHPTIDDHQTIDDHGGMEHLRPLLNRPYLIPANELIWMTDRTPHQAMPQPKAGYRQFFRLVTSGIKVWHADHSTSNPNVPVPRGVHIIFDN